MSFAAGYIVGRNAEASGRALGEAAAHFRNILANRQRAAEELTELQWCYNRIAELEAYGEWAHAQIMLLAGAIDEHNARVQGR